jgi:uncharacterized DUF497 family protein
MLAYNPTPEGSVAIQYVIWDSPDDPRGNVQHVAEHGLTCEDVEDVLFGIHELAASRASAYPIAFGLTASGEFICVVFEQVERDTVYPITAYVVED